MLTIRLLLILLLATPVAAAEISGRARVVDGDTLDVGGQKIRIEGIDAFETGQTCFDAKGREWACGHAGTNLLVQLTRGKTITCQGNELDPYGRLIADCFANKTNIGAAMVEQGLALVFTKFSDTYAQQEQQARNAKTGVWSGTFLTPWEYRAMVWTESAQAAPGDCPIKGNISDNGKIYHTPYSDSYAKTRIDESKGERWFCSEAEALAAGWRAPLTH
jgi:endonuclease YncB( thermonuclease family)